MDDRFEEDDSDLLSSSFNSRIFDRFDSSSSNSSEEEFSPSYFSSSSSSAHNGDVKAAGKKLDYMIQFLDRKLSKTNSTSTTNTASAACRNSSAPVEVPGYSGCRSGRGPSPTGLRALRLGRIR